MRRPSTGIQLTSLHLQLGSCTRRLIIVNMKSTFVTDPALANPAEFTFENDLELKASTKRHGNSSKAHCKLP